MPRLLVVDKDRAFLTQVKDLLVGAGHEVATCHDCWSALTLAKTLKPDAVILGTLSRREEAPELCRRLKREEAAPKVVVVDECGPGRWPVLEGRTMEAEEYLCRPLDLAQLLRVLNELLDADRSAQRARAAG